MNSEDRATRKTRAAGLAFMVGLVVTMVASFFLPGGFIIEYTDPADYGASVAVMADYANLGHLVTTVSIIGMLLMIGGVIRLYNVSEGEGALARPLLRFGIILTVIEWSIVVLGHAERHLLIHLLQRGEGETLSSEVMAQYDALVIGGYADMVGGFLAFLFIFPFASFLLGLGLSSRFSSLDIYKIASYALMLVGIVGFVVIMTGMHFPDLDLQTLLVVNNLNLTVGAVALFIIGLGMYQGRSELSSEG